MRDLALRSRLSLLRPGPPTRHPTPRGPGRSGRSTLAGRAALFFGSREPSPRGTVDPSDPKEIAMADVQPLSQFTLSETPDGYLIEIEAEGGQSLAVSATIEQIDAIIEALDQLLSEDDADADEIDEAD